VSGDDFLEELKRDFLNEALFMMEQYEESMLALESTDQPQDHISSIFRVAHSIKGGAAAVGFEDLSRFAHKAEDLLSVLRVKPEFVNTEIISLFLEVGDQFNIRLNQLKNQETSAWDVTVLAENIIQWLNRLQGGAAAEKKAETQVSSAEPTEDHTNYELLAELEAQMGMTKEPAQEATVAQAPVPSKEATAAKKPAQENSILKVDSQRVDSVLDVVGEIVVLKNQLIHSDAVSKGVDSRLNFIVDQLDKSIRDLYEKTLGIRMTPLKSLFMKLQRTVRDVSVKLDKPVDLQLLGEETEVDRSVFELLGDPLMHMARNAMDHGIENKEERAQSGKNPVARVTIAAKQVGGSVVIEISEDGRGISREKVIRKAVEKGLLASEEVGSKLSDSEVFSFLFAAGFSTAEKVTDLSGRGVGLDVVRSNIEKVKGRIHIESRFGQGTSFLISIPLTTSITDGIVVGLWGQKFMIPIHSIREIVQFQDEQITSLGHGGEVLRIRDRITPVIDIKKRFGDCKKITASDSAAKKTFIVLESQNGISALPVDEVLGQSQVVAKALSIGQQIPEFSGAATLGDGRTVLILEPNYLIQSNLTNRQEVA
jgi:two-component system chemotaxis sensor kinase CheA